MPQNTVPLGKEQGGSGPPLPDDEDRLITELAMTGPRFRSPEAKPHLPPRAKTTPFAEIFNRQNGPITAQVIKKMQWRSRCASGSPTGPPGSQFMFQGSP